MDKVVKYVVRLSSEERASLEGLVKTGKGAADKRLRAQILLKADVGEWGPAWADARIAQAFEVGLSTVHRLRQRLVEEGLDAVLVRKPSPQFLIPALAYMQHGTRADTWKQAVCGSTILITARLANPPSCASMVAQHMRTGSILSHPA